MHAVTPRMAPSANSSLALPPSAETIALWLAPVALRSSVIVPLALDALEVRRIPEKRIGVEI